jgi:hypothetical protein
LEQVEGLEDANAGRQQRGQLLVKLSSLGEQPGSDDECHATG